MEHLDDEVVIMNEVSKPPPPPPDEFGRMRREGVQVLEDGSGVRGNRSVDRQNNYKAKSIGPMSRPNQGPSRPLEGLMDTPILGPIGPIRPMDPPMQGPMRDPSSDWRFGRGSGQHPPPPAPQTGPPFLPNIPGHNPLSSSGGMPHPSMPNSVVHMGHNTNDNSLMEPGMNAWNGQAPVPPPPMGPDGLPLKQPITYRLSVLYPPNPAAPPPTTRERPPGCRTVFIGGLPELATQEIVEDVFGKCGDIQSIRMSKKNFCHIRYTQEYCVDNAVYLSGWRMRIDNSCETASTGRLHVDFAQARDDLYEWECMNRSLQREQRHITRVMEDMFRPPSPPPMPHFSDLEAHSITEQIKGDASNFTGALETLLVWLERGDCTKRNAHNFYTMIQAASTHVKRLLGEQAEHEVELARMKEEHRQKMEKLSAQFGQIERVFVGCSHQKVWDHFTKAQRKNIQAWRKQLTDVLADARLKEEEDMDLSEDEEKKEGSGEPDKKKRKKFNTQKLREESENWACQAQVYRNEVQGVRAELQSDLDAKDKQIKILQQTLQGMQQQLLAAQTKQGSLPAFLMEDGHKGIKEETRKGSKAGQEAKKVTKRWQEQMKLSEVANNDEVEILEETLNIARNVAAQVVEELVTNTMDITERGVRTTQPEGATESKMTGAALKLKATSSLTDPKPAEPVEANIPSKDAKLVAIIATFLNVHPFGAGTDYIWSYLLKVEPNVKHTDVEDLLTRYPECFSMFLEGVGASLTRKWKLVAFTPV